MTFDPGNLKDVADAPYYTPNLGSPYKSPAILSQSSQQQTAAPFDLKGEMQNLANQPEDLYQQEKGFSFNWDKTDAGRYIGDKNYNVLGFNPQWGTENESRYHDAQTFGDAFKNTVAGTISNFGHAFANQLLSWKDTASVFQDLTMQSAFTEESMNEIAKRDQTQKDKYPIFSDPNDNSIISWNDVAKGVQSAGNIFGSVAELAAENIAVGLAIGATFGGGSELGAVEIARDAQAAETATNAFRLSQSLDKAENLRKSWNAFKESKSLKDAWDTMKGVTGYAGDALSSIGGLTPLGNTAKWLGQDVMNPGRAGAMMKTVGKGFGAFYSDLRDLNLAVSMAQGNASNTYQSLIQKESQSYKDKFGSDPDGLALQQIQDNALAGAKKDGAFNAFVALYTNKLAFGNILKGNKSIEDALAMQGSGIFSKIGVNSDKIAKEAGKLFLKDDAWGSFSNSMSRGLKSLKTFEPWGKAMSHGLGFGLTMSAMETVDNAVQSYYDAKYTGIKQDWQEALGKSIDKEFSPEGGHTFISGFLTGTLLGPVLDKLGGAQDWLNNKRIAGKETPEMKAKNLTDAEAFVEDFNTMWKNPITEKVSDLISQSKFQAFIKNETGKGLGSTKDSEDSKALASHTFFLAAARNGLLDVYMNHLKDHVNNLSPEELVQAFHPGEKYTPELHQELLSKINEFEGQAKDVGKIYKDIWRKFPNPYNPSKFKDGTPEHDQEATSYQDYKRAVDIATLFKAQTQDKIERQNKILFGDSQSKGLRGSLPDSSSSTLLNLSHPDRIDDELKTLKAEEKVAANPSEITAQIKRLEDYKQTIIDYGLDYSKALNELDPKDVYKGLDDLKYAYDREIQEHLGAILNAEQKQNKKSNISPEDLKKAADLYQDYYKLGIDHHNLLEKINFILDPPNWSRFYDAVKKARVNQEAKQKTEEETKQAEKEAQEAKKNSATDAEIVDDSKTPSSGKTDEESKTSTGVTFEGASKDDIEKEKQQGILEALKADAAPKLNVIQSNLETNKDELDKELKDLGEIKKDLEPLLEKQNQIAKAPSKKGMKALVIQVSKLTDAASIIQSHVDRLLENRAGIQVMNDIFTIKLNDYDRALKQIKDTGRAIEIQKELEKLHGDMSILPPREQLVRFIEDGKSQIASIDKRVNELKQIINDTNDTIKTLDSYSKIYEAIKDAKTVTQYRTNLSKLYADATRDGVDASEEKKYIADILKYVNKLNSGEHISEEEMLAKPIANMLSLLEKFHSDMGELIGEKNGVQGKLEADLNYENQHHDLADKIGYYNRLGEAIQEKVNDAPDFEDFNNDPPFEYVGNTYTDLDKPTYENRKWASEHSLRGTSNQHTYPEHVVAELPTSKKKVEYRIKRVNNEKVGVSILNSKRLIVPAELNEAKSLTDQIFSTLDEREIIPNNRSFNKDIGNAYNFYQAMSQASFDFNGRDIVFGVSIRNSKAFLEKHGLKQSDFLNIDIDPDHEGILLVDSKGNFYNTEMKPISGKIDKKDLLFNSLPALTFRLRDITKQPLTTKEMSTAIGVYENTHLLPKGWIGEDGSHAKTEAEIKSYAEMRWELEMQGKSSTADAPVKVRMLSPKEGIRNVKPKKDGHLQKNSLIGTILPHNYDPKALTFANGGPIEIKIVGKSCFWINTWNNSKVPIYTSAISKDTKEKVVNALVYLSKIYRKSDRTIPKQLFDLLGHKIRWQNLSKSSKEWKLYEKIRDGGQPDYEALFHGVDVTNPEATEEERSKFPVNIIFIDYDMHSLVRSYWEKTEGKNLLRFKTIVFNEENLRGINPSTGQIKGEEFIDGQYDPIVKSGLKSNDTFYDQDAVYNKNIDPLTGKEKGWEINRTPYKNYNDYGIKNIFHTNLEDSDQIQFLQKDMPFQLTQGTTQPLPVKKKEEPIITPAPKKDEEVTLVVNPNVEKADVDFYDFNQITLDVLRNLEPKDLKTYLTNKSKVDSLSRIARDRFETAQGVVEFTKSVFDITDEAAVKQLIALFDKGRPMVLATLKNAYDKAMRNDGVTLKDPVEALTEQFSYPEEGIKEPVHDEPVKEAETNSLSNTRAQDSISNIRKQYAGGAQYFPINATASEVVDNLKAGGISAEDIYAIKDEVSGKLKAWFERGYQLMTGKSLDEIAPEEKKEAAPVKERKPIGKKKTDTKLTKEQEDKLRNPDEC